MLFVDPYGHHIVPYTQTQYSPSLTYQLVLKVPGHVDLAGPLINQENQGARYVSGHPQSFVASTKSSSQTSKLSSPDAPLNLSIRLRSSLNPSDCTVLLRRLKVCESSSPLRLSDPLYCSLTLHSLGQCLASVPLHDYQHLVTGQSLFSCSKPLT